MTPYLFSKGETSSGERHTQPDETTGRNLLPGVPSLLCPLDKPSQYLAAVRNGDRPYQGEGGTRCGKRALVPATNRLRHALFANGRPKRYDAKRQTGEWYIAHLKQKR